VEAKQDYGKNSAVNVEIIRELRPHIPWMKSFVFFLAFDPCPQDGVFAQPPERVYSSDSRNTTRGEVPVAVKIKMTTYN
jgi:hypothetical protein